MANFFSVLKKVGQVVVGLEPVLSTALKFTPLASIAPALDEFTHLIQGSVTSVEMLIPEAKMGQLKAENAAMLVENGFGFAQQVLAIKGEQLVDDVALRAAAIKAQADAYNAIAAWKQSFQISKKG